jgi:hypothetical protein
VADWDRHARAPSRADRKQKSPANVPLTKRSREAGIEPFVAPDSTNKIDCRRCARSGVADIRIIGAVAIAFVRSVMASAYALYRRCESQNCWADADPTSAVHASFDRQRTIGVSVATDVRTVDHRV